MTNDAIKDLRELWRDERVTVVEIGKRLGLHSSTIWRVAKEHGLGPRALVRGKCDTTLLYQLWRDDSLSVDEIAAALGCSRSHVFKLGRDHQLGRRLYVSPKLSTPIDPTPEEIAERAAECRERHFAEKRAQVKVSAEPHGGRCFSWHGDHYESGVEVL